MKVGELRVRGMTYHSRTMYPVIPETNSWNFNWPGKNRLADQLRRINLYLLDRRRLAVWQQLLDVYCEFVSNFHYGSLPFAKPPWNGDEAFVKQLDHQLVNLWVLELECRIETADVVRLYQFLRYLSEGTFVLLHHC